MTGMYVLWLFGALRVVMHSACDLFKGNFEQYTYDVRYSYCIIQVLDLLHGIHKYHHRHYAPGIIISISGAIVFPARCFRGGVERRRDGRWCVGFERVRKQPRQQDAVQAARRSGVEHLAKWSMDTV